MELRTWKQTAAQRLEESRYPAKKLVLLYAGVSLAFSLVLTLLNFILSRQIDTTGGLSGLGMRSVLSTAQSVLQLASLVLLPFWQFGFVAAGLGFARQENPGPDTLLQGFRRWGKVLGLQLWRGVIMVMVAVVTMQVSSFLFMLTPLSDDFTRTLMPLFTQTGDVTQLLEEIPMETLMDAMIPASLLSLGIFALVMIPLSYRFRMAEFAVMDQPARGGFSCLLVSIRLMHRNCMRLVKLDLSYWWFYLLQGIILVLGYGDLLLETAGVQLPISGDVAYFLFYFLYLAAQLGLYLWAKAPVQTTYSLFYDEVRSQVTLPEQSPPKQRFPWQPM